MDGLQMKVSVKVCMTYGQNGNDIALNCFKQNG